MYAIFRTILLSAIRDRLFLSLLVSVAAAAGVAVFFGGTSLVEQVQTSVVLFAGIARILVVLGLILFITFYLHRAFDAREIEVILSKPISRTHFVLASYASFALLAALLTLPVSLILLLLGVPDMRALAAWESSLLFEALLMTSAAVFFALLLKSPVSAVMATLGLYALGRMIGLFVMAAASPVAAGGPGATLLHVIMLSVSTVMPRLDFFADGNWLVYGLDSANTWRLSLMQAATYTPLLLASAVFDFRRRQF